MRRAIVLALVFVGAGAGRIAYDNAFAPNAIAEPLRVSFTEFPLDVAGPDWRGETSPLTDEVVHGRHIGDRLRS